ncbi:dienelactone hydrolase [Sphingomonas zeicaulis]|uniref:alpha/beta hydrolase n=1 Tax=Sphingomonas zeicaulis TaxID=1632740 RepID=UPI003D1AABD3
MRVRRLALALLLPLPLLATACDDPQPQETARRIVGAHFVEPVLIKADDGVIVHGLDYRTSRPRAVVLLFHQAGSSKAEYNEIAAKLIDRGFNALAIDQRSGGNLFGINETVQALGRSADYAAARPDLDAALAWAKGERLPVILWGSSYTAGMVFELAADHPGEIAGVLAFSPGEYREGSTAVATAAGKVDVPIYVTAEKTPEEARGAKAILAASPSKDKIYATPRKTGVHGSSTLIAARNPEGADDNWKSVDDFLDRIVPPLPEEDEQQGAKSEPARR